MLRFSISCIGIKENFIFNYALLSMQIKQFLSDKHRSIFENCCIAKVNQNN